MIRHYHRIKEYKPKYQSKVKARIKKCQFCGKPEIRTQNSPVITCFKCRQKSYKTTGTREQN